MVRRRSVPRDSPAAKSQPQLKAIQKTVIALKSQLQECTRRNGALARQVQTLQAELDHLKARLSD